MMMMMMMMMMMIIEMLLFLSAQNDVFSSGFLPFQGTEQDGKCVQKYTLLFAYNNQINFLKALFQDFFFTVVPCWAGLPPECFKVLPSSNFVPPFFIILLEYLGLFHFWVFFYTVGYSDCLVYSGWTP